jgi:fructose-bisphosphate aldolase / 2-amino-3,7-dideoxy-D-threo-hept-6-ulosonate synthase
MDTGKILRLRRILKKGRSLIVPMDHALYFGPVPGLHDLAKLVAMADEAGADGILVPPGRVGDIAAAAGDLAVLLRLDGTCTRLGNRLEQTDLISSVEEAVRLGVDAVVLNVYTGVENEDFLLAKLGAVAEQCRAWGMPLIGEMLPAELLPAHYGRGDAGLPPAERADRIAVACRAGVEIGADLIKTPWSGTAGSFRFVTEHVPRPVLAAGGVRRGGSREYLAVVREIMDAGAAGVCAGRNVWERENGAGMLRAMSAIIHENACLEAACEGINGTGAG